MYCFYPKLCVFFFFFCLAWPLTDHTCHDRKLKLSEIDSSYIKTSQSTQKCRFLIMYRLRNGNLKIIMTTGQLVNHKQKLGKTTIGIKSNLFLWYSVLSSFHLRPFLIHLEDVQFLDHWSVTLTTVFIWFVIRLHHMFSYVLLVNNRYVDFS